MLQELKLELEELRDRTGSDAPLLLIESESDPRLTTIRTGCGERRPFALLWIGGVRSEEAVRGLIGRYGLNGVLLSGSSTTEVRLYTPEGSILPFDDAPQLAAFLQRRAAVRWFRTVEHCALRVPAIAAVLEHAQSVLGAAQQGRLLRDRNGNVALRIEPASTDDVELLISPRGVNKGVLSVADLCRATVDVASRTVACGSLSKKSSIDTGVLGTVFARRTWIAAALHFHPGGAIVLDAARTTFPYPCGTVEESDQLLTVLPEYADAQAIEMVHHGYLLAFSHRGMRNFVADWHASLREFREHLNEIGAGDALDGGDAHPILIEARVPGIYFLHRDGWASLYVRRSERGRSRGVALAAEAARRGVPIAVHADCRVQGFYERLGWRLERRAGPVTYLVPPAVHSG